ncbi:hypothetical protein KCU71_g5031, partial [Aureobasidium melanogenum]
MADLRIPWDLSPKMPQTFLRDDSDEWIIDVEESDEQTLASQTKQVTSNTITTAAATPNTDNTQEHGFIQGQSGPGRVEKRSQAPAVKSNASKVTKTSVQRKPVVTLQSRLTLLQKRTYDQKLGRINQKLRKKTVEELTNLYNATENASFRDAIMTAFHQKRMDELKDWEEQIGE